MHSLSCTANKNDEATIIFCFDCKVGRLTKKTGNVKIAKNPPAEITNEIKSVHFRTWSFLKYIYGDCPKVLRGVTLKTVFSNILATLQLLSYRNADDSTNIKSWDNYCCFHFSEP